MALNTTERDVVQTLIASVRTIAVQLISLHLQLGTMRSLFAKKHMMSEDEFQAAFAELEASGSLEERLQDFPDVMEDVFEELLRRLQAPQHLNIASDSRGAARATRPTASRRQGVDA